MASLAVLSPSPLFRAGLAALLRAMGFEPVEDAANPEELEHRFGEHRPEIVLIRAPSTIEDLGASIQRVRAWAPGAKVVILAPTLDQSALRASFAQGAAGYLLENISRDGLQCSLQLVSAGENVLPSQLATALSVAPLDPSGAWREELRNLQMTDQEIDILRSVASGETNARIAKSLGISESEVSAHLKQIQKILGLTNRTQAALWAVAKGLAVPSVDTAQPAKRTNGQNAQRSAKNKPPSPPH